MRAVAILCSVGRPSLEEVLGMWALQSLQIPLFVALDVHESRWLPEVPVRIAALDEYHALGEPGRVMTGLTAGDREWVVQRAPESVRRGAHPRTIGPLRAWAVDQAVKLWQLDQAEDAFLVLDDDDYYSPSHAHATLHALHSFGGANVVGARDTGILWSPAQRVPELVRGGPYGPGPHATWGVPLRAYRAAGGYQADPMEDLALLSRIGWQSTSSHFSLTHVRTQHSPVTVSSTQADRAKLEVQGELSLLPRCHSGHEALARWCRESEAFTGA